MPDSGGGIGDVVQDAEGIGKVERMVGQRNIADARVVKRNVPLPGQVGFRYLQRLAAGIEHVKASNPRRHQKRPPAAPAAGIEAFALGGQFGPGKNPEILGKQPLALGPLQRLITLREGRPFSAKTRRDRGVSVPHPSNLRCQPISPARPRDQWSTSSLSSLACSSLAYASLACCRCRRRFLLRSLGLIVFDRGADEIFQRRYVDLVAFKKID